LIAMTLAIMTGYLTDICHSIIMLTTGRMYRVMNSVSVSLGYIFGVCISYYTRSQIVVHFYHFLLYMKIRFLSVIHMFRHLAYRSKSIGQTCWIQ
jgi:multisubunit Na+/H+ antiporter MnhE subunit